jgi:hypothetical protein
LIDSAWLKGGGVDGREVEGGITGRLRDGEVSGLCDERVTDGWGELVQAELNVRGRVGGCQLCSTEVNGQTIDRGRGRDGDRAGGVEAVVVLVERGGQ